MKKIILLLTTSIALSQTFSEVRIKNLTYVEDTGKKQLIGYGLVVVWMELEIGLQELKVQYLLYKP